MKSRRHGGGQEAETTSPDSKAKASASVEKVVSNTDMIEMLTAGVDKEGGARFEGALRTADDIESSGVLEDFATLQDVEVPEKESERTVEDDAVLVMRGLSKMSPEEIIEAKEAAYELDGGKKAVKSALDVGYFGSEDHRAWGALVEKLSGGVISAEEAMAMNPSGGMIGPGVSVLRHLSGIDSLKRHAMRHDATGFLLKHFNVGPGYSTKTSVFGMDSDNPLSGQLTGWSRELFGEESSLDSGDEVAKPDRFAKKPTS